jgi:hypothetical protein
MSLLNPRLLIVGSLALLGCATARPLFEREFREGSPRALHDAWMRTLQERYGCDTVVLFGLASRGVGRATAWQPPTILVGPDVAGRYWTIPNPNATEPNWPTPPMTRRFTIGATPCDMAYAYPTVVRAWATSDGIREDWMNGHVVWYQLMGPDPPSLRLSLILMP